MPTVPNQTSGADCPECAFDRSTGNIHAFVYDQPPLWLARMLPPAVAPDFVSRFDPFFVDYSRVLQTLLRIGGVWKEAFVPAAAPAGCPSQRQEKRSNERLRRQTEKRCRKVRRRGAHRMCHMCDRLTR